MAAIAIVFLTLLSVICSGNALPDVRASQYLPYTRDGPTTSGTDFMVGFLPNLQAGQGLAGQVRQLLVSTDEPEPVTFTVSLNENLPADMRAGFPLTATVSYGEVKVIDLPGDIAPTQTSAGTNTIERSKAIRIVTEGGKKVSVQGFNDDFRTTDGFTAYSCDGMRTALFNRYEYVIVSADQTTSPDSQVRRSAFLIIPCDDDASMLIEPSQAITLTGLTDLPTPPRLLITIEPPMTTTFTANAGQTILISITNDLSGTVIRSSKPLALFSGHECGNVPVGSTACDHMVEQMPPGLTFGQTVFVVPFAGRVSGDMIRVATLTDGTQVTVTCVTSSQDSPRPLSPVVGDNLIDRGEYLTFMTPGNQANQPTYKPSYCCIDANKPILVVQYGTGYTTDSSLLGKATSPEAGDPFMSVVPSVTQYMNNYTLTSIQGSAGPFPDRFVNLAIAAEFFDNSAVARSRIKINGSRVSPIDGYVPFYCSNNEICGYGAQVAVPAGVINVYHEIHSYGLMAAYYAYQQQNSFGFPQGFELTPISATRAIFEDITVPESIGTVTIAVRRVGDLNQRSKGELAYQILSPEEATVGEDFVDFGPILLDYFGGNRRIDVLEFQITIQDDDIPEPTERFQIHGTNTQNLLFTDPFMTVTILDDDGDVTPGVFFDPTSYTVNEDAGVAILTVRTNVPGGPVDGAVQFYTEDGSATAPGDYSVVSITGAIPVNFQSGQSSTTVTVPIRDDEAIEPDEAFFGRLRSTGIGDVSITQDRAEIVIVNDDEESAVVSLSPLTYEVVESDGTVNIVLTKTGNFQRPIAGTLTTATASAGALDYIDGQYQFVIQPEQQQVTIPINVTDDTTVEQLREQFSVSLSLQPQAGLSLGNAQGAVTIVDDDVEIGFNPAQYRINERERLVTFEVENRNPERGGEYTVQFITVPGSAVESTNGANGDYLRTEQVVTFSQGDERQTVTVQIIDDTFFEILEEFTAQLTSSDRRVNIVESEATAEIVDNDNALEVSISPLGYEVDESAGVVQVTVQKSGTFPTPVTGTITASAGTAGSTDFTGGSYPFTIGPNEQQTTVNIPIINDGVVEQLRELFSLSLTIRPQPGLEVGNSMTSVTIIDDDGIVISLEPSTQTVSEGGDAVFRIVATGDSELPYSVTFETEDGSARAPGDYRSASLTLTRTQLQGDGFQVRIPVQDDNVVEATERFMGHLQLTQQSLNLGVVSLGQSMGEVTITDNDVAEIGFAPSVYSVTEDSGSVIFFIQNLNPDIQREVVVEFMTVGGTATDGSDYVGTTETVTFLPGQTLSIVQVMIIDDSVYEGIQDFSAVLTTTDSSVNIFEPDATAQITDDDEIVIQFNPSVYTVTESGSTELVIQKIGTSEEPVTVSLTTQTGTATNSDFVQISNQPVTFGTSDSERRVIIQTNADNLVEGDEMFTVTLVPVSDRVIITEDSSDITIEETANVFVEFQPNSYTVCEDDGIVSFVLVKRTPTTQDVTVQISTVGGSATSGSDYSPLINEEVTFGPSETIKFVMVPITEDNVFEGEESFTATLSLVPGSSGVEIGQQGTATTTIVDDIIVSFSSPEIVTPENRGSVEICLTTSEVLSQPLTVVVLAQESVPADAGDGVDFSGGEYRIEIPSGTREHCTNISVIDDSLAFEGDEVFVVKFDISQLPDGVEPGPTNISVVRIIDDDVVRVFFDRDRYQGTENNGPVEVCVRREGDATESFTINVATSESNPVQAQAGSDYVPVTTTLTFNPEDEEQCFQVFVLIDELNEGKEDFIVDITSVPDGVLISRPDDAVVSILDANVVTVEFGSPNYSVPENEGTISVCLTTNIGSDQPLSVIVGTAPKTATAGIDYDGSSQIVQIPASHQPGQTCFDVNINDDTAVETDEEFLVNFQISAGSDAQIGAVGSTCIQIIDDDEEIRVFFESDSYTVAEDSGSVTACIIREGGGSDTLSVQVGTRNLNPVDASDGSDYRMDITTVTFQPNENRLCFNIEILNDQLDEGTESFSADILSVPSDSGVVITNPDSTIISIIDDDVTINFGSSTYTVNENGGSVSVCLTTSGSNNEPLPVIVSASPTTASANTDYSFSPRVVTIPPSSAASEYCFDVDISDDSVVEPNEEFVLNFQVPTSTDGEAGSIASTTVTIVDDDVVTVDFGSPTYSVFEDDGDVEVCLRTNAGNNEPVTLVISTAPKSATAGQDYMDQSRVILIPASSGPTENCFEVPIIDDSIVEDDEEFLVNFRIASGSNAVPGSVSSTCITIIDDDQVAVVEFEEPAYTVSEDGGEVEVCLRMSGMIGTPAVVQLLAIPDTAEAGLDYVPGILNFVNFQPPGDSVVCTSFEIIDDLLGLEDVERFFIDVVAFEGPVEIGRINRTVISIEDNDIVSVRPSTENEIVLESEGMVEVCLMKNINTTRPIQVNVVAQETSSSSNPATAGSDFIPLTSNIIFGPLDREVCTKVDIINDDITNENPEEFEVSFRVMEPVEVPNTISTVTIIDDDVDAKLVNDTVIADPLFTAPVVGGGQFCYEIHGKPNTIFNLVSDRCTLVNARYVPMNVAENGNIIGVVGIRSADADGNCHTIEVRLSQPGSSSPMDVLVDGVEVSGVTQRDSVRVRAYSNRVRISVPNCELVDLVMWVIHMEMDGQHMLKYVIMRGCNLAPTSHGLVGQFWNIPVTVTKYNGPLEPEYESLDRDTLYLITVTPITGNTRSFLGELDNMSWDRKSGPCYYVGNGQGGRTAEREENESVIEGRYTDYQVQGLFDDKFAFSQFEKDRCSEAV